MAQSKMADPKDSQFMLKRTFSADIMDQLKATTSVFFYKKENELQLDSLKQAVTAGWDLTPLVFADLGNFSTYASDPKYSYFVIEGITTTVTSQTGSYTNTHYYLTLQLFKGVDKKGKMLTNGLCRIELYPNNSTLFSGPNRKKEDIVENLYRNGIFFNWSPVLLQAQLQTVESNLKNNLRPWLFQNTSDENLSSLLSRDTLYVPKSLLMDFNKFSGKEKNKEQNIFAAYPYKYRICTDSELFDIFETQKRGRFLFEYVKSSTDKFVSIYDVKAKKLVYKKYTPVSYNLKAKDLQKFD